MKSTLLYYITAVLFTIVFSQPVTAQISVDKSAKNIGSVQLYTESTTEFTLKNSSSEDITINKITTSSTVMTAKASSDVIPAGGSIRVSITNQADLCGRFTRVAYVYTSASDKPIALTVKGKTLIDINAAPKHTAGIADPTAFGVDFGDILLNTDNIEFDRVNNGDVVQQIMYVTNNSEERCEPNLLLLPPYLSVKTTPAVLNPGRTGKMVVTLDSRKMENRLGLSQNNVYISTKPGEKVSKERAIPVSVVLIDTSTVVHSDKAPILALNTTELDLPTSNKAKIKGTISITNNGQSILELKSIQTLHPAINVSIPKTQIAPGETIKMSVTVIKKFLEASNASHRILLISNDYSNPIVYIMVKTNETEASIKQAKADISE